MKSIPKLIRRYVSILLLSCILLFALNFILLAAFASRQTPNSSPWKTAEEAADALQQVNGSEYSLPEPIAHELKSSDAWAIFIDEETKQVKWQKANLPKSISLSYSLSDIASLIRGYIDVYANFTVTA